MLLRNAVFLALAISFSYAHANGMNIPGRPGQVSDSQDLNANMEMLRAVAESAPELVDSNDTVSEAVHRIGSHTVRFDGAFHRIFRTMIRNYDKALRAECDSCAQWDPQWFESEGMKIEAEVARSFWRRKVTDPLLDIAEHTAFEAGLLGGELGKTAFLQKVLGEAGETALSVLWAKVLGPMHFFCHIIDAWIIFGTRYLQTQTRMFTYQKQFGGSIFSGAADFWKFAYFNMAARNAEGHAQFVLGPFEVDEARLKELDLQGSKWWGFADRGNRRKFLDKLVAGADKTQLVWLNRKSITAKRMKRFAFMVARPSFIGGRTPMDRVMKKSQLWVLAVQEQLLQKVVAPIADEEVEQLKRKSLEETGTAPHDEVRRSLAEQYAPAEDAKAADFNEQMLRAIELLHNPEVPRSVRLFHARFIEAGLRAFIYGRTADVLEDKIDLINTGEDDLASRARDIKRQFAYSWRYGMTARFMGEFYDSLKLASLQKSKRKLVISKYESMELMLKVWNVLTDNTELIDIPDAKGMEDYRQSLRSRLRSLMSYRPWQDKIKAASLLPFGFTYHPWSDERSSSKWFPFFRNVPLCRDLHVKAH